MTLAPGTTLGRYQILEPLGSGGMASVYRAYQPALDRVVALKVLRPNLADDPEFRSRFEREAKAVARLRHPHIVQVFDFEQEGALAFIVMEFIAGGTLKARVGELETQGQKLPVREVSRIVGEVADALGYAHAQGIVHRDIKPSNVLLTPEGKAVVADFGIARLLSGAGQTATGVGLGTPEYMSPEQGQGQPVDARSDIYSLGVLAYELLTGSVPYRADTPFAVVLSHVRDPLPLPSSRSDRVGPATERALLRALAKDPAQRFAAAPEFAQSLARAVADDGRVTGSTRLAAPAPVSAWRTRLLPRPARLVPGAIAALLLIYGGGTLISGALGSRSEPAPSGAPSVASGATALGGVVATATPITRSTGTATVAASTATTPTPPQATATLPQPTSSVAPAGLPPAAPTALVPIAAATATLPPPTTTPRPTVFPPPTDPNAPRFAVTGRATSALTGAGLSGVQIGAFPTDVCCYQIAGTQTDGAGNYTLNLPNNTYHMQFLPPASSGYAPMFYGGGRSFRTGADFVVNGSSLSRIDAQLVTGFLVSGRVTTQSGGAPPPLPSVSFNLGASCCDHIGGLNTASDGTWSIRLTNGSYYLNFFADCRSGCQAQTPFASAVIGVNGADVTGLNKQLPP